MKRSNALKRRVREIETASGAGALTLTFPDGSQRGFNLSRRARLQVLLASFDISRQSRNPEAKSSMSARALEIAQLIGQAEKVTPPSRLWNTVAGIIQGAEKDKAG
jgi:flagellar biosynthesis/type III secretory pathway protein FliH